MMQHDLEDVYNHIILIELDMIQINLFVFFLVWDCIILRFELIQHLLKLF